MTTPPRPDAAQSLDRALLRGMVLIGAFAALAAGARVAQDMAIAWRFGAGPEADAYHYALGLLSAPVAVAIATLSLTLTPAEAALRTSTGSSDAVQRWRAQVLTVALLAALVIGALTWGLTAWWLRSTWAGLATDALRLASTQLGALAPVVTLGMVSALLTVWLVADRRASVSLFEAVPPLVLVGILLASGSAAGLFWGTTLGVSLQVIVLAAVLAGQRALPLPSLRFDPAPWDGLARGVLLVLGAQAVYALVPLVDPLFAAHLGEGAVATLGYANRLLLGLQGLIGLALQRAALPLLAQAMVQDPRAGCRAAFRWAALAAVAGLSLALVLLMLADPVISLLFERGRFTAANRAEVAALVQVGLLQLPALLAGLVLALALASSGDQRSILLAAIAGLAVKIMGSALLAQAWGARGLVAATALMYVTTAVIMAGALVRRSRPHLATT